jgi:hypothetical protein
MLKGVKEDFRDLKKKKLLKESIYLKKKKEFMYQINKKYI